MRTATKAVLGAALALGGVFLLVLAAAFPMFTAGFGSGSAAIALASELGDPCQTGGSTSITGEPVSVGSLAPDQERNASIIVQVGVAHKVPTRGLVIAIATALQESTLHNYDHGDRDSLGLFQQRPSQGWGTPEQVRNPQLAAEAFYGFAKHTQNTGLLDIGGWQDMELWVAAQSVQRSGYPTAYADDESAAVSIVNKVLAGTDSASDGGGAATDLLATFTPAACGDSMSCPPLTGSAAADEQGLTPDALIVARCVQQEYGPGLDLIGVADRPTNSDSDHPSGRAVDIMVPNYASARGRALGDKIAAWARDNARAMGVTYVIWNVRIWSVERADEGWRPYEHPSGATDYVSLHKNHVHVSVAGNAAIAPSASAGKWVLPIAPGQYALTATFGECGGMWANCHTGLDFDTSNDPASYPKVRAASSGTVTAVIWDPEAYGHLTKISHGGGVETWYAHQNRVLVQTGQQVRSGQEIGVAGGTGNVTGEHLHFEVRQNGQATNPDTWLRNHGVTP